MQPLGRKEEQGVLADELWGHRGAAWEPGWPGAQGLLVLGCGGLITKWGGVIFVSENVELVPAVSAAVPCGL